MRVVFTRTAPRRYSVTAEPAGAPRVAVHPAPGYHDHIPHDLVHFVAEREFGLADGIFGSVAAGGDAGTFRPVDEPVTRRSLRRGRRRGAASGADLARSELLAGVLTGAWRCRHEDAPVPSDADRWLAEAGLTGRELDALLERLDEVARSWHALDIGAALVLDWPGAGRPGRRKRT